MVCLLRIALMGSFFNLKRLQAKSKVHTEFLFANDMAKSAPKEEKMQKFVDQTSDSCDSYDLTISIKKERGGLSTSTWQALHGAHHYSEMSKIASGSQVHLPRKSRVVHIDVVNARIPKASAAFGRLRGSVSDRSGIGLDTKLKVNRAVVLPTLLYACETWTVYQRHAERLNHFYTSCLRKLLKIKWQDRISDTEVLKRARIQSVYILLKLPQLKRTYHVTRMPEERLPKKILDGELEMGKRSHGGQKKRYAVKASLEDFNVPTELWEQIAQDRAKWRGLIRTGASN